MSDYVLEARNISKSFPGVKALSGVNLKVKPGEVLALVGENGAGKSTLMHVLGGVYSVDEGELIFNGSEVVLHSAQEAQKLGISIVYQELSLVQNLSVAENIFTNRQPVNKLGFVKKREMYAKASEMLELFSLNELDPRQMLCDLSIGHQQVIEILKAMAYNPKVLILDEPTSSLSKSEVEQLFGNIRILKERGIAIIYISHHLSEIFEIADKVMVLRDGQYICENSVAEIDEDYLVTKMVGRRIQNIYGERETGVKRDTEVFRCDGLSRKGAFSDISFSVCAGEIVGMYGLVGAGRTEIGRAIFGAEPASSGKMFLEGEDLTVKSPEDAIRKGIGYMTEDRKNDGLYTDFGIKQNYISNRLFAFTRSGFLREKEIAGLTKKAVDSFNVITPNIDKKVGELSGGNQQKVLLSMWCGIHPKLLIVDEPTRGVDVGAKSEIYKLLRELAATGMGILMLTSDLPEFLHVSDRMLIIENGRLVSEMQPEEANEENVVAAASGVRH